MASSGKEYLVWLTTNGLAGGTQVSVDYQDSITLKTGFTNKQKPYKKNQAWTAQAFDGADFDMTILLAEPLTAAAALMMDSHDNGTVLYVFVQTAKTGGQRWQGQMISTLTQAPLNVADAAEATFNFSQAGTFTRSTV